MIKDLILGLAGCHWSFLEALFKKYINGKLPFYKDMKLIPLDKGKSEEYTLA
jgi:hypothetical protein